MKKLSKNKGFTMIELMIALVIIGIIASIAFPNYTQYVTQAKRGDAKTALLNALLKQEKYRANHTSYGSLSDADIASNSPNSYYKIAINGTPSSTSFTVTATPATTDSDCAIFVINQSGKVLSGTYDSKTAAGVNCWNR
ncbi:MAG: prepilin-type N-terminal cleavage/methylation domain-containing protein [Methyloprofundus sp.]|nr:prepilin-type N-terminal cleavage/methylation domain-containing protein [Methyloprofundus sp.]